MRAQVIGDGQPAVNLARQRCGLQGDVFRMLGYGLDAEDLGGERYLILLPEAGCTAAGQLYAVHPSRLVAGFRFPVVDRDVHWWPLGLYRRLTKAYVAEEPGYMNRHEAREKRKRFIEAYEADEPPCYMFSDVVVLRPDGSMGTGGHLFVSLDQGREERFVFTGWSSGGGGELFVRI